MAKEWLPNGAEWQESGPENTAGIEMAKGSSVRSNNQYSKTVLLVLTVNRANSWRSISCQSGVCQCVLAATSPAVAPLRWINRTLYANPSHFVF